jgi:diketogulonate reductase-like aldo/keto reductase
MQPIKNPTLPLTDGLTIPQMGFGTYGLGRKATEAIVHALRTGYRHIDTADMYGSHENIAKALPESGLKREEIFIVTKLMSQTLAGNKVGPAVDRFLSELDTDYIDLLLIHWPGSVPVHETLAAMDAMRRAGKVRAIGVSNFNVRLMKEALATGFPVCNNQIEYNLNHQPADVLQFCQAAKVTVTAYSPLEAGGPQANEAVAELAKQYGCTKEEILLAWLMAKGMIVIPRSSNFDHIETNFNSLNVLLREEELKKLETSN